MKSVGLWVGDDVECAIFCACKGYLAVVASLEAGDSEFVLFDLDFAFGPKEGQREQLHFFLCVKVDLR